MLLRALAVFVISSVVSSAAATDEIRVAGASNFSAALEVLSERFEETSGHDVLVVPGSTGKHYAQIRNGAPFDLFLAADVRRPELLERDGLTVPGSRFTYAIGHLVLWSPRQGYVDVSGDILVRGDFRYLSLANPELAPYGRAARETLLALGAWDRLDGRMVRGENVAQAFQFVASGNAELGLVALSQVTRDGQATVEGSFWEIHSELHQPIEQQAVLLEDTAAARALVEFLRGDEARAIIRAHGYTTPD